MSWPFPDKRERLRRQAARWLARLQGEPSDAELEAFRRWRDGDPARAEAFARVSARYDLSAILGHSQRVQARGPGRPQSPLSQPAGYALAAVMAALLLVSGAVLLDRLSPPTSIDARILVLSTGIGEIRTLALPDGTRVTLDTATSLHVEMRDDLRRVTLNRGRARFKVAAQDGRPFEVEAGANRLASTGTFDVSLHDDTATVHAREGNLSIGRTAPGSTIAPVDLEPGEGVIIRVDGQRTALRSDDPASALWPTGRLEFDDTPLELALAEANRYSRAQIELADPALGHLRLTGVFRAGDTEALARGVAAAHNLRIECANDRRYILYARR